MISTDIELIKNAGWDQFVNEHQHGNIFQTSHYFHFCESYQNYNPGIIAYIDDRQKIKGILLFVIQSEGKGLKNILTSRAIIRGGPLVEKNNDEILDSLLKEYKSLINGQAIFTEVRNMHEETNKEVFLKNSLEHIDHLNLILDLTKSTDILLSEMHSTRRKQIRRAAKRGLEISMLNQYDEAAIEKSYLIIQKIYKREKLPLPNIELFKRAGKDLLQHKLLQVFLAKFDKQIVGSRWVLSYGKMVYDWYAGSDFNFYDKYPNDALAWEAIKWGAENNYQLFDFGGAGSPHKNYGVRDYKVKFGGAAVNQGRYLLVHKPVLYFLAKSAVRFLQMIKKLNF